MTDKERLENMSPIGFDLNGDVLLKSEDYHWLLERAEYVEELEEQNRRYREALEEIARDRLPGASYKARQALEGDEN